MMPAAGANIARPRVPHNTAQMSVLTDRVCDKLYDACNATDIHADKMASMRAQVWQQNNQFRPHQQNSHLQLQSVPAYMAQQPVSACGQVPGWSSRFSGQLPYQQPERLPQHHQLQQQRHLLPSNAMIRHRLPTYQNVVDERVHQDMMLKHSWQQQQQQRHLMHFQSVSHHHSTIAGVASEPCDVGGFRQAASNSCMISLTSASAVSSTVWRQLTLCDSC